MIQPTLPKAEYRYWVCDLRSGNKLAQLPLKPQGPLPERIGDASLAQFSCDQYAVWRAGGDFIGTTTPGKTVVILEREYEGDSTSDILWAGIIIVRDAGSAPEARLNCATIPAYLNRREVGTHTYLGGPSDTDTQVITDLLADAATEGINLVLDVACPTLRTVRYRDVEHTKVLQALKDLSARDDGPEWTITARWYDATRTRVQFVFLARTRLGWAGDPNVTFAYPGSITSYSVDDDYSEDHGANHITGINQGGAASDPARDEEAITSQGWARWQQAIATSGELNADGLAAFAKGALASRARGQTTNELQVSLTYGPQYVRDLSLGDNVLWTVAAPAPGEDPPSARHPDGHREVLRMIGIQFDVANDAYTPVLWNPYEEAS